MNCHKCKQTIAKADMIGANIFDASTGTHIITRWYCIFCADVLGLLKKMPYTQATTEGDAL